MAGPSGGIAPPLKGLVFWGQVTQVVSATQCVIAGLIGQGENFFFGWAIHVVRTANGGLSWPILDEEACVGYVSSTGLFTHPANLGPLTVGDEVYLIHRDIASIFRKGFTSYSGYGAQNWNSGVATSGEAGGDLGLISAPCSIQNCIVSMRDLTPGANITIRMYTEVDGVEDEFYHQTFVQGTDPDAIPIIDGVLGIYNDIRIEAYSDQAGDDGLHLHCDYVTERAH